VTAPLCAGDPFVLGSFTGFGVVLSVNHPRGVALVALQSGLRGEMSIELVTCAREALAQYRVDS
jgi:hypothetical protein